MSQSKDPAVAAPATSDTVVRTPRSAVSQVPSPLLPETRAAENTDETSAPQTTGAGSEPGATERIAPLPGTRVAQFELIREVGRGGMGQVYLARDTRLGRLVALKFLWLQSPDLLERFLVEARATAQCNHENIVVVYEADEWHGQPYLALEYLEGEALSRALGGRAVPPRRAVELMVPVVRALVRAHELGIVHRDLKPDNVFVTRTGLVKVLDFGIAKLFGAADGGGGSAIDVGDVGMTRDGALVGTIPYMAPEQWGADAVDHRADIWAVGIMLWEMLAGRHPLAPVTKDKMVHVAAMLDVPMPSIAEARPDLPGDLERVVNRCLAKRKEERFASALELAHALEALLPVRPARRLDEDECPYPGLRAFQESDADRFLGRGRDVDHLLERIGEQPLIGVLGPSGVGKSSFVRAGVVPALKASGEPWEVLIARPGRSPLAGLAALMQTITHGGGTGTGGDGAEQEALIERLRAEPGALGTLLRTRARQKQERILLFVDQFEELYTLVADADERHAFAACLAGVADEASTPLRVVIAMRSDFVDRAAEHRELLDRLTRGLLFLPVMDRAAMRAALVEPLEMVGHAFESESIVADMLAALDGTPGALPLLQFTAATLWESRDRTRRILTRASYDAIGGVAGALATHADEVLRALTPAQQRLTRTLFQRLVTAEGTRAVVDAAELRALSPDPAEVQTLVDHLVGARLLAVQRRGEDDDAAVELVHESLITRWPALRRWCEESAEDSAFLEQLRTAAKQWEARGRPPGLLWRGEATDEAQRFHRRHQGALPRREREYLDAVVALATRSARRRRGVIVGAFAILLGVVAAGAIALVGIRNAERTARDQQALAETEAARARTAEARIAEQLATITDQIHRIERAEAERAEAARVAAQAAAAARAGEKKLTLTYEQLAEALETARRERGRAETERTRAEDAAREIATLAEAERAAKQNVERLLAEERARVKQLEEERRRLSTQLK